MLLKNNDTILRVLQSHDDKALVIDCVRRTMPKWVEKTALSDYVECCDRIGNKVFKAIVNSVIVLFIGFMVIGRLVSGVHWFTDIIGGALISSGLIFMYRAVAEIR